MVEGFFGYWINAGRAGFGVVQRVKRAFLVLSNKAETSFAFAYFAVTGAQVAMYFVFW
jgi:hypothetical protein